MWIFTNSGFFSVVRNPDKDALTVCARVAADLDRLRERYAPALSPTVAGDGTDYPYCATIGREAFAQGLTRVALDLDYANFKDEVAATQGDARAAIYGKVWGELLALDGAELHPSAGRPAPRDDHAVAYGGVVLDDARRVLLRESAGHFGGIWTFPKGRPEGGEKHPADTATREVREETGINATIVEALPGAFAGVVTETRYFLMAPLGEAGPWNHETRVIRWADQEEAARLLALSPNAITRARDLRVLALAFARHDAQRRGEPRIAAPHDWFTAPLPGRRATLAIERSFSADEMARLGRGLIPDSMDDRWFVYWDDAQLFFHRSWTGFGVYIAHLARRGDAFVLTHAEVNRDPEQYAETDDRYDTAILNYLLDSQLPGSDAEWPLRENAPEGTASTTVASVLLLPDPEPRFHVASAQAGGRMIEAWSTARLPFEPKDWRRDFRQRLREAVSGLVATSSEVLHAVYISPVTSMVDAENVLFYNVDSGRFAAATREGLRFERVIAVPPPCPAPLASAADRYHYHAYRLVARNAPFQYWTPSPILVRWEVAFPNTAAPWPLAPIWYALKRAIPKVLDATPLPGRFGLRVVLTLPAMSRASAVALVKPVFDGVVSALHQHDGTDEAEIAARLAHELHAEVAEIIGLLQSRAGTVLGTRRVVWPWGATVQWNPRDEDCFAGELLLERDSAAASCWLRAEVFAIEQIEEVS